MSQDNDAALRQALREEEEAVMNEVYEKDPGVLETVLQTYRVKRRWLAVATTASLFVGSFLLFFCAYRFFQAEDQRALIGWAAGFLFCANWVSMLKIWAWVEMSRHTVLREVKRMELQVAKLNDSLESCAD